MEKINETAKILVNDSCIYFNNDVFKEVVKYDPKNNDKNLLIGKNSFTQGKYYFRCELSFYISDFNYNFGYKVLNYYTKHKLSFERVQSIFKIQNILSAGGFAPKAYEIINCYDQENHYYAIKMENIKGKFVRPNQKWIDDLTNFCKKFDIVKFGRSVKKDWGYNCVSVGDKTYLVDIDQMWVIYGGWTWINK